LVYDEETKSWRPDEHLQKKTEHIPMNNQKHHGLLRQFYTSIPIDIVFEEESGVSNFYRFTPIWNLFKDIKFVVSNR